jgi:hypothetical protein
MMGSFGEVGGAVFLTAGGDFVNRNGPKLAEKQIIP